MKKGAIGAWVLATLQLLSAAAAEPSDKGLARTASFEPYTFSAADGTTVSAQRGELQVPENRQKRGGRTISLAFVRFPSTADSPGEPIVYLAGGPGGSGIAAARGERFALFMKLREVADVIALDQRGTGDSNQIPRCDTGRAYPIEQALETTEVVAFLKEQAAVCGEFWRREGVDISGYTTMESAADLEDLRQALGARKLNLWGISYGTHLALATLKHYPSSIDRVVLASVEGLDDTLKLPAHTDAFFDRLRAAMNSHSSAQGGEGLKQVMRRVFKALERSPVSVDVVNKEGVTRRVVLGKLDVQLLTSGMISDPSTQAYLPVMFRAMAGGDFADVGQVIYDRIRKDFGRYAYGMPEAMDAASGASKRRLDEFNEQVQESVLGGALNFPAPYLFGSYGVDDLGDAYRQSFRSPVPALILSGTLDGRTYPEGARAVAAQFSDATLITVENGGHNLLMSAPEIGEAITRFLQGRPIEGQLIRLAAPTFAD